MAHGWCSEWATNRISCLFEQPKKPRERSVRSWKAGISSRHVQAPSPSVKIHPQAPTPVKGPWNGGCSRHVSRPWAPSWTSISRRLSQSGVWRTGSIPKWWWKSKGINIPQNYISQKKHFRSRIFVCLGFFPYPRNQSSPPGLPFFKASESQPNPLFATIASWVGVDPRHAAFFLTKKNAQETKKNLLIMQC